MNKLVFMVLVICMTSAVVKAQQQIDAKVDIAFNRFYDLPELEEKMKALAEAHPEFAKLVSLGQSVQGREMWMLVINNPATGTDTEKPAMWIDGNVHGNEIQAGEAVLYTAWYLLEAHDEVPAISRMLEDYAFYLAPCVNPDGRAGWFRDPHTPHSNRTGLKPTDNDQDGLLDEDGPDDLDGDGHIGQMWRKDPQGAYRRSKRDPRIFEYVDPVPGPDGRIMRGEWSPAGREGIDNDGDGRINEDGEGGYDMNRNWPTDWKPEFVQRGAGTHPFSYPETRAVGDFIRAHPNIAAGQSYHNAGGMILRGPGSAARESEYPRQDLAVYEALGKAGEEMLPYYSLLVIHSDLYPVHGGFVNWLAEGLGIVSYTNELWSDKRILQNGETPDQEGRMRWQDRMLFGQSFTDWTEVDHPRYGKVLVGGGTKYASRNPPPFMLEEESHRNFAFTMFHAGEMPVIRAEVPMVKDLGNGTWQVDLEIANDKLIPTRTAIANQRNIGRPDLLLFEPGPGTEILVAGTTPRRSEPTMKVQANRPERLLVDEGIPSRGMRTFRYLLKSDVHPTGTFEYRAEKARDIVIPLGEVDP